MDELYRVFWELMCKLYKLYGRNCPEIPFYSGTPAKETAQFFWDLYSEQGAPPVANATARQQLLDLLDEIEALLKSESNSVDATTTTLLLDLVTSIRNDVT